MLLGMGEMTQGQKRERDYFRSTGHLRTFIVRQAADSLTAHMRSAMATGDHYGRTVIGKKVTRNALYGRGLIDGMNRWTALGWAVVLLFVSEEPGWSLSHFKTPDDVHAEALAEDAERAAAAEGERFLAELREDVRKNGPTPKWEDGIPGPKPPTAPTGWTRLDDRSRHVLTGVEVVTITPEAGPAHFEVRVPRWIDSRKLMETVHRGSRFSAANWAMEVAVPDALYRLNGDHEYALRIDAQRTARRNRVQHVRVGDGRVIEEVKKLIPGGWAPEHPARLAAEVRSEILSMDIRPGSLAEAAAIVDGVVKTAQLAALRAVLASLAAWIEGQRANHAALDHRGELVNCWSRFDVEDIRNMVADAARDLRVEWP